MAFGSPPFIFVLSNLWWHSARANTSLEGAMGGIHPEQRHGDGRSHFYFSLNIPHIFSHQSDKVRQYSIIRTCEKNLQSCGFVLQAVITSVQF